MTSTPQDPTRDGRNTRLCLYGLAVGILGLVIQWITDPGKFPGFPPGIALILVCGALVALWVRWWTPIFGILISAWILIGGLLSEELTANLVSGESWTFTGNIVMCTGLVIAMTTGTRAMINGRSTQQA